MEQQQKNHFTVRIKYAPEDKNSKAKPKSFIGLVMAETKGEAEELAQQFVEPIIKFRESRFNTKYKKVYARSEKTRVDFVIR